MAHTIMIWFILLQASKQHIILSKRTPIAQVMTYDKDFTRPTQPSYIGPPYLEKNLSSSTPYHWDDKQTYQSH